MQTRKCTDLKDKNTTHKNLQSVGIAVEEILLPFIFTLKRRKIKTWKINENFKKKNQQNNAHQKS